MMSEWFELYNIDKRYIVNKLQNRVLVDEQNKIVVLIVDTKRFVVKCDKKDKFDFKIGVGLALSKLYYQVYKGCYLKQIQYLRNHMNYKEYAYYCFNEYFSYDENKIAELENNVKNENQEFLQKLKKYKEELAKEEILNNHKNEIPKEILNDIKIQKTKKPNHKFIAF